ncbi:reprolysin-like metallopeptidase [Emticicia agri]|uniref:Peptidase M12B domain-containing protein n=1 Tax=Emticicia agri TaxID=2492393 RepID=A0A4Q5LXX2_9BACT|nr:3-coathanger stack domain-containing protein [Emticicia agri]RYU94407.1 hypothetical protein EWM59_17335 [Emticicia agri]
MKKRLIFSIIAVFWLFFQAEYTFAQGFFCNVGQETPQGINAKNLRPNGLNNPSAFIGTNLARGTQLRVLRLAVSVAGEYTQSVTGANDTEKKAEVIRQMKEWLKEINNTYGREYCVRFELIPDNLLLQIIYTDGATDPWPNMSGAGCDGAGLIHNIQPTVIDNAIGAGNYDFSEVIIGTHYNGGCAVTGGGLSYKQGYSAGFNLSITRHEIGHQFHQSHIINNGNQTNYEPENAGRSIHGGNTDPYAHSFTYHQLANTVANTFPNVGTDVPTGNTVPTVNAGVDRAIPVLTPFTLTGTATDPDPNNTLTYVWDQLDGGVMRTLPTTNDTEGALFSRLTPTRNNSRTYPKLSSILANNFANAEEDLPFAARDMNFRLTVNDNNQFNYNGTMVNASGTHSDDIKITVVNNGGAFQVTSQSTAVTHQGGGGITITWNICGTDLAPINVANVKILLSSDGGLTFPMVLNNSTPNDGTQTVTLPNISTTQARVKVEAIDNIFFSINKQNFTINQSGPGIAVTLTSNSTLVSENGQTDTYTVNLRTAPNFGSVTVNISANAQTEISLNGVNFAASQAVILSNTIPVTITVRGKYDDIPEGNHTGLIQHTVGNASDQINYPLGMAGPAITVNVADAQIPPIIGVDFDTPASTNIPMNWAKISDLRNASLSNLLYDDGTPTSIGLTTSAPLCGIGNCAFDAAISSLPEHAQSLSGLNGIAYVRNSVTFTWNGLQANATYRVFIFGRGLFGPMDQTVTISGSGTPVVFTQKGEPLVINDFLYTQSGSPNDFLINYGRLITASATGIITISVSSNLGSGEMSFMGIGIQKAGCPQNLAIHTSPIPSNTYQASNLIQSTAMVESGSNVTFTAGTKIQLTGNFRVKSGANFRGKIGACL